MDKRLECYERAGECIPRRQVNRKNDAMMIRRWIVMASLEGGYYSVALAAFLMAA